MGSRYSSGRSAGVQWLVFFLGLALLVASVVMAGNLPVGRALVLGLREGLKLGGVLGVVGVGAVRRWDIGAGRCHWSGAGWYARHGGGWSLVSRHGSLEVARRLARLRGCTGLRLVLSSGLVVVSIFIRGNSRG